VGAETTQKTRENQKIQKSRGNFLIFMLFLATISASAQDTITLRNGSEIKANVMEISAKEVKYKWFDNLNSPVRSVSLDDVYFINYENGTKYTQGYDIITFRDGKEIKAIILEISTSEILYKRYDHPDGIIRKISLKDVFAIDYEDGTQTVINQISKPSQPSRQQTASKPSNAQFKSTAGDCGVEVQFIPFSTEVGVIQTVKFEFESDLDLKTAYGVSAWFLCRDRVELRVNLLFGTTSLKDKRTSENEKVDEIKKKNWTTYGFVFGTNFHFKGTARISPYMGLNMFLGTANYKNKINNWNFKSSDSYTEKVGMIMTGFNLATGFNWYIVDGLYIGAEIGLGLGFGKFLKQETQTVIDGSKTTKEVKPTASGVNVDFIANPAIRLGWRF